MIFTVRDSLLMFSFNEVDIVIKQCILKVVSDHKL